MGPWARPRQRRAGRTRTTSISGISGPLGGAGAGGGGAGGAGGEGAAGHGDRVGDERERDDTWDPRVSVYVCVKLNKWIAKLLEGTTK